MVAEKKPAARKPKAAKKEAVSVAVAQKVFVAKTGAVAEVTFTPGLTLGDAIKAANQAVGRGIEVRINGKKVTNLTTKLKANDQIILLGQIAGAR